jgi:two-component system chemotaxis response regulator CheB
MKRIGVMIVDDSAVVRQVLTEVLTADPEIEVQAAVADPLFALARMKMRWPDVILLDVEMPLMDVITFLRKLMAERPTPVVICSTLTEAGATTTVDAIAAGAVSIVTKPKVGLKGFLQESAEQLIGEVKAAAQANVKMLTAPKRAAVTPEVVPRHSADSIIAPGPIRAMKETTEQIVAIGTSTGGTQALELVLTALPRSSPGIAVVQHMPELFTAAFAQRLDGLCEITVREAVNGERLLPGHALIAPGGKHLLIKRNGAYYHAEVVDGPYVNRHKPSVDVLFRSVARSAGANALGIIMTGMGDDGARGLKEMRDAGARTVAQDEASCVVFGMPKEAIRLEAAQRILPLVEIPSIIR